MQQTMQRILNNSLAMGASYVADKMLYLIFYAYLARVLGDIGVGKFSFASAFTALFAILIDFGLGALLVKDVARDKSRAREYLSNIIVLRIILSVIVMSLVIVVINVIKHETEILWLVYILGLSTVLSSNAGTFMYVFRAFQEMHYMATVNILGRMLSTGAGMYLLYTGQELVPIALSFLGGSLFSLLLSCFIVRRKFTMFNLEMNLGFCKFLLKDSLPFTLNMISIALFSQIDTVMLSMFEGDAAVGWYSTAHSLAYSVLAIPFIYGTVLFPVYSQFYEQKRYLRVAFEKSFKYFLLLGLGLSLFVSMFSMQIVLTIFGTEFANSVVILAIMIWVSPLLFYRWVYITMLGAIDKQVIVSKILVSLALLNIVLNALLIPPLGGIGATIAALITETVGVSAGFYFIYQYIPGITIKRLIPKAIAAACLFSGFLLVLSRYNFSIFLLTPVSVLAYLVILVLMRVFDAEEINLLKSAFRGKAIAR